VKNMFDQTIYSDSESGFNPLFSRIKNFAYKFLGDFSITF